MSLKLSAFTSACSRLKAQKSKLKAMHFPACGAKEESSGGHSDKLQFLPVAQGGLTSFSRRKVLTLSPKCDTTAKHPFVKVKSAGHDLGLKWRAHPPSHPQEPEVFAKSRYFALEKPWNRESFNASFPEHETPHFSTS